jgi:DNA-binding transcriptional LysR family regulator
MASLRDLDVRHLEALVAVADEGSFGRAAARLGFSQAAISQQVAALERAMGATAFDRPGGPRRVELTPAGRVMLEHARGLLERLDRAESELADLRAGTAGRIVVGTFQSVSVRLLPAVVALLRAEAPRLDLRTVQSDANEWLADELAEGHLDVSFLVGPITDDRLDVVTLREDPFVALVPADSVDAGGRHVAVAGLVDRPMVGSSPNTCQLLIEKGLRDRGVEPTYAFRSEDNGAIQAMVRAGLGPAIVPLLAVDTADPGIRVLPLDPPIPPRTIEVATRRGRTLAPGAQRFVELSRQAVAAMASELDARIPA